MVNKSHKDQVFLSKWPKFMAKKMGGPILTTEPSVLGAHPPSGLTAVQGQWTTNVQQRIWDHFHIFASSHSHRQEREPFSEGPRRQQRASFAGQRIPIVSTGLVYSAAAEDGKFVGKNGIHGSYGHVCPYWLHCILLCILFIRGTWSLSIYEGLF